MTIAAAPKQPNLKDTTNLAFEVASVKPNKSGDPRMVGIGIQPGGRFTATNASLRELIAAAYGSDGPLQAFRISGGPSWINSDRFDIATKAESEPPLTPMAVVDECS